MDKNERDRLRALCEKATPGPWRYQRESAHKGHVEEDSNQGVEVVATYCGAYSGHGADNAEFIAAARTALPAALNEVDRLSAVLVNYWARFGAIPEDDTGQRMMWRLSALEAVADAAKLHRRMHAKALDDAETGEALDDALAAVAAQKAAK